jgi:hypothetical protein
MLGTPNKDVGILKVRHLIPKAAKNITNMTPRNANTYILSPPPPTRFHTKLTNSEIGQTPSHGSFGTYVSKRLVTKPYMYLNLKGISRLPHQKHNGLHLARNRSIIKMQQA